mgnify:CR=1 FL=1
MSEISNLNEKTYTSKIAYCKPSIIELSTNTGTQGKVSFMFLGMTYNKVTPATESYINLRSPS